MARQAQMEPRAKGVAASLFYTTRTLNRLEARREERDGGTRVDMMAGPGSDSNSVPQGRALASQKLRLVIGRVCLCCPSRSVRGQP